MVENRIIQFFGRGISAPLFNLHCALSQLFDFEGLITLVNPRGTSAVTKGILPFYHEAA
jgi:hypothetical protein